MAKLDVDLAAGLVRTVRFESSNTTDLANYEYASKRSKGENGWAAHSVRTCPVEGLDLTLAMPRGHVQEGAVLGLPA